MNKKLAAWVIGGLFTATAIGWGISANIGSAAEKPQTAPPVMQGMMTGNMDPQAVEQMQNQCIQAMKSPEMQKRMQEMMSNPEMQKMMKQMGALSQPSK